MNHHFDPGSDSDFNDPSGWNRASYNHHPCDDFEPLPDTASDYRAAALAYLETLKKIDVWLTKSTDAHLA